MPPTTLAILFLPQLQSIGGFSPMEAEYRWMGLYVFWISSVSFCLVILSQLIWSDPLLHGHQFALCAAAAAAAAAARSLQSCPTLCDPIDGSPPGSPVPGILQARTLGWVAVSFSSAWEWKVKVKPLSRVRLLVTPWTVAYQAPPSMDFPGLYVSYS